MVRRLVLVVVFAWGAAAGLVGCGSEESAPNDLLGVDTVPPAAVADLQASVRAISNPSVELRWTDGFEADLAGYRVYRYVPPADVTGSTKRGGARIDAMALIHEGNQPLCVDANVALGESYYYAVAAVDVAGNESPRALSGEIIVVPNMRHPDESFGSD